MEFSVALHNETVISENVIVSVTCRSDLKLAVPHPNLVYGVGDGVLAITSRGRRRGFNSASLHRA